MNQPRSFTKYLLVITLLALLMGSILPVSPIFAAGQQANRAETDETGRTIEPATDVIAIATGGSPINEYYPQVAFGDDYYMVAYYYLNSSTTNPAFEVDVAVFNNQGQREITHIINNQAAHGTLSIAYHAPTGLFLLAYTSPNFPSSDFNVYYTAVSPITGRVGDIFQIPGASDDDDLYPSVACAQTSDTCLLAFERNGSKILGRYIALNSAGIVPPSFPSSFIYKLTDKDGQRPYITWGKDSGYYLLAYTRTETTVTPNVQYPVFTHVYDSNPGNIVLFAYAHDAVDAGDFTGMPNDKWATGVAYDPCTQKFVLLWDYYNYTNGDVAFSMVDKTAATVHAMGWIADTGKNESSGDISFVTDDSLTAACGLMDKLVVTYAETETGTYRINAAEVQGNSTVVNSSYTVAPTSDHLLVYESADTIPNKAISISNGSSLWEMFVAFDYFSPSSLTYDIFGRIIRAPEEQDESNYIFLPLLMR